MNRMKRPLRVAGLAVVMLGTPLVAACGDESEEFPEGFQEDVARAIEYSISFDGE